MKLKNGDIIEHVDDCLAPKEMAGSVGQRKTIGKDIDLYYARRLLKGNRVKLIEDKSAAMKGGVNADGGRNQKSDPKGSGKE